jgi:stage II sporulation protein R
MIKTFFKNNIKQLESALLLGLVATIILQSTVLAQQCNHIREQVFRLHILANSDQSHDQLLKLKVRDRLITEGATLFTDATTKEEAILLTKEHLDELTDIAKQEIVKNGYDYTVTCKVEDVYFNTRTYDNAVTLPAGNYTALQVVIGEGKGKNWWCVMFPNLCIPAATDVSTKDDVLDQVLTQGETDLVENGQRYQVKFKTVEWFQKIANHCREWF